MSLSTLLNRPSGWDSVLDFGRIQDELDQLFGGVNRARPFLGNRQQRLPLLNVVTNDRESVLTAELPGVELKDIEITLTGTALTLKGERKNERHTPEEKYFRRERGFGPFGRTVELPHKVNPDAIEATLRDGVLTVRLPKAPEVQPRQIHVRA